MAFTYLADIKRFPVKDIQDWMNRIIKWVLDYIPICD